MTYGGIYKSLRVPDSSSLDNQYIANDSSTSAHLGMLSQFILEHLKAQTISGTVHGVVQCYESNVNNNASIAVAITHLDAAGQKVGTVLVASASDNALYEMATSLISRQFADASENLDITITSTDVSDGDSLCIEIGVREVRNTGTEYIRFGCDASSGDLPDGGSTSGTTYRGWIEFSDDIRFTEDKLQATLAGSGSLAAAISSTVEAGGISASLAGMSSFSAIAHAKARVIGSLAGSGSLAASIRSRRISTEFLRDTFTDTDGTHLDAHTGETGATWTKNTSFDNTGDTQIVNNRLARDGGVASYYASGSPGSAEYDVWVQLYCATAIGGDNYIFFRMSTSQAEGYCVQMGRTAQILSKVILGVFSTLDTQYDVLPAGEFYELHVECRDALKSVYLNGTLILQSNNNDITDAGRVGVSGRVESGTCLLIEEICAGDPIPGKISALLAGSGALSASIEGRGRLIAGLAGSGSLSGAIAARGHLTASAAGTGALSGSTKGRGRLVATLAGLAGCAAALKGRGRLAMVTGGTGTLVGQLSTAAEGKLNAVLAGAGNLAATIKGHGRIVATIPGIGSFLASIHGRGSVKANLAGIGALSGSLQASIPGAGIRATLAGAGALVATVKGKGRLSGRATGAGALSGSLHDHRKLRTTMAGIGALASKIKGRGKLLTVLTGASALNAFLLGRGRVTAFLVGRGTLTAILTGPSPEAAWYEDDVDLFFDETFSIEISVKGVIVPAIYDDSAADALRISGASIIVICPTKELPAGVTEGDDVQIGTVHFHASRVDRDHTGLTRIQLEHQRGALPIAPSGGSAFFADSMAIIATVNGAEIRAFFADPYESDFEIAGNQPKLICWTDELPAGTSVVDLVTVGGASFHIAQMQDDQTGLTLIRMERQSGSAPDPTEDRDPFFDDFGTTGQIGLSKMDVIFDQASADELAIKGYSYQATVKTEDLTEGAGIGSTFTHEGTKYTIKGVQRDGVGMTMLQLREKD